MTTDDALMTDPRRRIQLPPPEERDWEFVQWEITASGVLAITLHRPEQLNALNFPLIRELLALVREVAPRPEVRVLTIGGLDASSDRIVTAPA